MKFDLNEIKNNYLEQLKKIEASQITELGNIKKFSDYMVLVIGGSVYQIKDRAKLVKTGKVPVFVSKDVFLKFLEEIIDKKTDFLILNLAWPFSSFLRENYPDGKLITGTKEHEFVGLVGKKVGEEIEKYLWKIRKQKIKIAVLNDVVSLVANKKNCIGGVVGTGLNFGFWINDNSIVNLETGSFGDFEMSETGKKVDELSVNPGKYKIEKEIAGAYLYKHFNLLSKTKINSTKELSEIAEKGNAIDKKIARDLLERSASLVSVLIKAIMEYLQKEQIDILIEGSLFWKGYLYKENVYRYLEMLGVKGDRVKIYKLL